METAKGKAQIMLKKVLHVIMKASVLDAQWANFKLKY
jgi:hypothetical protein